MTRIPGPNVVTLARPLERDRDDEQRPDSDIDRAPACLSRHGERGRDRVPDDGERQRSEHERLQSPHATLPSPPTTVSARAWAANGQPAIVAAGVVVSYPSENEGQPERRDGQRPTHGDERAPRRSDRCMKDARPRPAHDECARNAPQEGRMRRLVKPETESRAEPDEQRHDERGSDNQRHVGGEDRRDRTRRESRAAAPP